MQLHVRRFTQCLCVFIMCYMSAMLRNVYVVITCSRQLRVCLYKYPEWMNVTQCLYVVITCYVHCAVTCLSCYTMFTCCHYMLQAVTRNSSLQKPAFHCCTFSLITAHFVHHCTLKQIQTCCCCLNRAYTALSSLRLSWVEIFVRLTVNRQRTDQTSSSFSK